MRQNTIRFNSERAPLFKRLYHAKPEKYSRLCTATHIFEMMVRSYGNETVRNRSHTTRIRYKSLTSKLPTLWKAVGGLHQILKDGHYKPGHEVEIQPNEAV